MYNLTFLIGNGFDLELGLDISYKAFIKWYLTQPCEDKSIERIKEEELSNPKSEWWADAEIASGKAIKKYQTELENYLSFIDDFEQNLMVYLQLQQQRCDYGNQSIIFQRFLRFLTEFPSEIIQNSNGSQFVFPKDDINVRFIIFNYTNIVEELVSILGVNSGISFNGRLLRITQVNYVHGVLAGDNSIVTGVDNASQISLDQSDISDEIQQAMSKSYMRTSFAERQTSKAIEAIESSNCICVYGFQMGDSDLYWRNSISKWLENENHQLVIFGNDRDKNKLKSPYGHFKYLERKQKELSDKLFSENTGLAESCLKRVFFIAHTDLLSLGIC